MRFSGRNAVYAVLVVLASLCCVAAVKPGIKSGDISAQAVGMGSRPQPTSYTTHYNVYTMDKTINHAAVNILLPGAAAKDTIKVDNQDRAIVVADSLHALGLGNVYTLGVDDTTFAYAMIDTLWTATAGLDSTVTNANRKTYYRIKADSDWNLIDAGSSRARPLLVHFDPKVPAGATIVSATFHLNTEGAYTSGNDSTVAVLMSHPAWNAWYRYRGQWNTWNNGDPGSGDTWWKYAAKCGYTNQVQYKTSADRHGFHYTTRAKWYPAWSTLNRYYEVGDVADMTSLGNRNGDGAKKHDLQIDITDCVQAVANGATNNGIAIWMKIANAANRTLLTQGFELTDRRAAAGWFEVKYITRSYATNFPGGKTFAFVFQTDDGNKGANDAYAAVMASHNGHYTIYATKAYLNGVNCTAGDLLAWYNAGHEIGAHSRAHIYADAYQISRWGHGPAANGYAATDTTTYAAGWDSMRTSLQRSWLIALGDSLGVPRTSRRWARSMALPGNQWSPWTEVLCKNLGYESVRCGQSGPYGIAANAGLGAAFSDTAVSGMAATLGRAPRDVMMLPTWIGIESVVGAKANTTITEAEVKANFRKLVEQLKADGRQLLSLYTHDFKTNPHGLYYSEGLDAEELDWLLDIVEEEGGWVCTATEYTDWIRAHGVAIDRPHNAHRDSTAFFGFASTDRVFYKPNGIDNRWIAKVFNDRAGDSYDITAPGAPTSLLAVAGDRSVSLVWGAAPAADARVYKVYRYYTGAADTTYLAALGAAYMVGGYGTYTDQSVVNGTACNYFVTATDGAGNEGRDSAHVSATPIAASLLAPGRPAYFALWYDDPPMIGDSAGEWSVSHRNAVLDSLAAFDAIVTGPFAAEGGGSEPFYSNLVRDLRIKNADEIVLMYCNPWMLRVENFAGQPSRYPYKRLKEYADTGADSSGYALDPQHRIVRGYEYRVATTGAETRVMNFMRAGAADTAAFIWAEAYEKLATGMHGDYTGLFIDDLSVVPGYAMQDYDDSENHWSPFADVVDCDQDNKTFGESGQPEQGALEEYHVRFIAALRREFAKRGLDNRLIVGNTTFGRADDPGDNALAAFAMMDGAMIEGANVWWPGNAAADSTWAKAFAMRSYLTHAQVSPPMAMIMVATDSSAAYQSEVFALASDTWVNVSRDAHHPTRTPTIEQRLPNPGVFHGYTIAEGGADPDTLTASWTNLKARIWLERNPLHAAESGAIMPYVAFVPAPVPADNDTLRRSAYWENIEDAGPPAPIYAMSIPNRDRVVPVTLGFVGQNAPGDFRTIKLYRSVAPYGGSPHSWPLYKYIDPDTLRPQIAGQAGAWYWEDTRVTNADSSYGYKAQSVDILGQEGPLTASDGMRTPRDLTPPPTVENLSASGGTGLIALDWEYPTPPDDFARFRILRGPHGGTLAKIDSVSVSYYNDTSAISGIQYDYAVTAVDDDWKYLSHNVTVVGMWMGSSGSYPPPSNIRAFADNPSDSTAVVVYPPTDTTGLTGYTVYRGYKAALSAVDTAACIKRISINGTPNAFNGYVFYDATANTSPDSAFQYTARALYSGHASTKYAVPAWALTTGGISAQTPTCTAFGNGSSISVAVGTIAGCDSTRIFRGTSAATQTLLATVLATNNPYTDATALANTSYYYKARQSASGGTVLTQFSDVSGPARWVSVPAGSPTISGVTGTIVNGQSAAIAGANFGSKATPAPLQWDNFEENTLGSRIELTSGTSGYAVVDPDAPHSATNPYSVGAWGPRCVTENAISGSKAMFMNWWGAMSDPEYVQDSSVRFDSNLIGSEIYIEFWYRYDGMGSLSRNNKIIHVYGNGSGELPQVALTMACNQAQWDSYEGGGNGSPYGMKYLSQYLQTTLQGSMHKLQFYMKRNPVDDEPTGLWYFWIDGQLVSWSTNYLYRSAATTGLWHQIRIGYWNGKAAEGSCVAQPAARGWIDDIYIDNTRSRVEIGNNADYTLCTHREIQIPSAWSANGTSITVTLNTGSFANGTAYLFVVDSDGNVSAGYPITIANP